VHEMAVAPLTGNCIARRTAGRSARPSTSSCCSAAARPAGSAKSPLLRRNATANLAAALAVAGVSSCETSSRAQLCTDSRTGVAVGTDEGPGASAVTGGGPDTVG